MDSEKRPGESERAWLHRLYPDLGPVVSWLASKLKEVDMSPYEDHERLTEEVKHLRELLRQSKKIIDHQQDRIREYKLAIVRFKEAIEAHDEVEHECYNIYERMVIKSGEGGSS